MADGGRSTRQGGDRGPADSDQLDERGRRRRGGRQATLDEPPPPEETYATGPSGDALEDRFSPHDDDAEADLIAAVMFTSGRVLDDINLAVSELYRWQHQVVFAAMRRMHADGRPVDPTTLADHLRRRGELDRIGGLAYLASFTGRPGHAAVAPEYARIVRERAARRDVITAGVKLQQLGATPTEDVGTLVEDVRSGIDRLAERVTGAVDIDQEQQLDDAIDAIEHGTASLATAWDELDHLIGGWRRGAVYVVAARPGGGKSIFGVQAAVDVAVRHGLPTVIASLEMTRTEVLQRCFSQLGPVNLSHIMRGGTSLGVDEWDRIARARAAMSETRFVIDDRSHPTVADLRGVVVSCVRRHGSCGLLVVDYLQLVASAGRAENRQTEVAGISRALKVAAKDLDIPVVVMAQLNRAPEGANRPPRPSDLRESGAVEQDGDVVILLHRDAEKEPHVLQVAVGKNRHGPVGGFSLQWEGHYSRLTAHQWTPSRALQAVPS